jgi:hypothetical protein
MKRSSRIGSGRRGREKARALIGLAIGWGLGALFLWVAQRGFMGDGLFGPGYITALRIAGVASYLSSLAWMVRIYRASLEPGERTWRYRDY